MGLQQSNSFRNQTFGVFIKGTINSTPTFENSSQYRGGYRQTGSRPRPVLCSARQVIGQYKQPGHLIAQNKLLILANRVTAKQSTWTGFVVRRATVKFLHATHLQGVD